MKCYSLSLYFACYQCEKRNQKYKSTDDMHCLPNAKAEVKRMKKSKYRNTYYLSLWKFMIILITTHNYPNLYHKFTVVHLTEEHLFSASPFQTATSCFILYLHSYICVIVTVIHFTKGLDTLAKYFTIHSLINMPLNIKI